MDRHTGVTRGVVRVAATAADAPRLPEALADFHGDHPGIQIGLRQGSAAEVVALVAAGTVDVAVLALTEEPAGVDGPPAGGRAAAGRGRRSTTSSRARRSRWTRCAGAPFILAEPGTALRETVMAAAQRRRVQPAAAVRGRRPADRALPGAGRARASASCRRAGSSGRGRSSARRTFAIRRATGCSCSRPPRGPHRPAGSCTSACSSSELEALARARADERLDRRAVLEEHERRHAHDALLRGELLLVVDVDADDLEVVAARRAISSRIGFIARHGGHHAAVKSTSTGLSDSRTSAVKCVGVTACKRHATHCGTRRPDLPSRVRYRR